MISISRKNKDKIVQILQEWFKDNLDQDIGNLDAEFLTDFFTENIGALYYNQALKDVHTLIYEKTESLVDNIYELSTDTAFE